MSPRNSTRGHAERQRSRHRVRKRREPSTQVVPAPAQTDLHSSAPTRNHARARWRTKEIALTSGETNAAMRKVPQSPRCAESVTRSRPPLQRRFRCSSHPLDVPVARRNIVPTASRAGASPARGIAFPKEIPCSQTPTSVPTFQNRYKEKYADDLARPMRTAPAGLF